MPVTDVVTDTDALTLTLTAEFPASVDRLWHAFTEPRQLERFWGPPGWPASFGEFDFTPGGRARYTMHGPRGERADGAWEFLSIDAPTRFEVLDEFVDDAGRAVEGMPTSRASFSFEATDAGSRVVAQTVFPSAEALDQLVGMGMVEGSRMAFDQLDTVLRDLREYAAGRGTQVEILTDQHVRITRLIEGSRDTVWRAHHDPELIRQWMLGPDGWRMTVCEFEPRVDGTYRNAWAPDEGVEGEPFGFDGEVLLWEPTHRSVTTEHMTDTDYPSTTNDLSLYEEDGATLLTLLIEYPDAATRDAVLATGMADGMEASYARLERMLANVG